MPHLKYDKKDRPYRWRTQFNNEEFPSTDEISFKASETRPNEVMSIREIEQRYAGGKSIMDVLPKPVWDQVEEPDFSDYLPDMRTLDHEDRLVLMDQAQFELDEIKKKANELAASRKAQREAEKLEQERLQAEKIAAILAAKSSPASAGEE